MKAGVLFALGALLTMYGLYVLMSGTEFSVEVVWWYGWLTAASTGLGVVPFLWVRELSERWLGVCNGAVLPHPPPY